MSSLRSAAKMSALMSGLKQGREERRDLAEKRLEKQRKDEDREFQKKERKYKLDKMEREGQMDRGRMAQIRAIEKEQSKASDAQSKLGDIWLQEAEKENTNKFDVLGGEVKKTLGEIQAEQSQRNLLYLSDKDRKAYGISKQSDQPTASSKALGTLATGDFADRTEAEQEASSKLGIDWQKKFPQARKILDKRWGPKGGNEVLPNNVKTVSQAEDYLVNTLGMTEEAAKDWIIKNK